MVSSTQVIADPGLDTRPQNASCVAPDRPLVTTQLDVEVVANQDISWPVEMLQHPADSSIWYVVDRSGYVAIYQDGPTFTRTGTLIDITSMVQRRYQDRAWNEMGLLGMALHPDFAANGEFFLYFSRNGTGATVLEARLARFTSFDGGLTADPATEEVVLRFDRNRQWHWGGRPTFGSDGYLYMSTGDGGPHHRAQDLNNINGKFLRIDVDGGTPYAIPPDNPFVGIDGLDEIYAYGFRNPWRWSFDAVTGDIWEGDVGPSEREEVNRIYPGGNYGWSLFEGTRCKFANPCDDTGLEPPVFEYTHDTSQEISGFAIIGGYVYRGSEMPAFYGRYIFADTTGKLFGLDPAEPSSATLYAEIDNTILSITESTATRELYLLSPGAISRVKPVGSIGPSNFPETLSASGCVANGTATLPAEGLIPYDVNVELWSDGAEKSRWMALPDTAQISVNTDGDFEYPAGSVLVKEFRLGGKRIETRWMVRHDDGQWAGYSFEWDDSETDATLVPPEGKEKAVDGQVWQYPSRKECLSCHTSQSGFVLGPETAQLNGLGYYPSTGRTENQLETLEAIGMFDAPLADVPANLDRLPHINDTSASLEERARGYLHANCAMCHQPDGPGQGPEDFRYWLPTARIGAVYEEPTQGDLGVPGARLITPGDPARSVMLLRMQTLDATDRMPPLASGIVDATGTQLVSDWIQSMSVTDTISGINFAHDAQAQTFWMRVSSNAGSAAALEAFTINNGALAPLGPLRWNPNRGVHWFTFSGVPNLPDCIAVSSDQGGYAEFEVGGRCEISPPSDDEFPLEAWGGASGGVSAFGSQISYSGLPGGWNQNSINSASLSSLGVDEPFEVKFRIDSDPASTTWIVGLGLAENGANWRDVDFGLRSSNGTLTAYENGVWRTSGSALAVGDVVSIFVNGGTVEYRLNDTPFHTSTAPAGSGFYVDTSFKSGAISLGVSVVSEIDLGTELSVTNWVRASGGVSYADNSISYSGSPTGWFENTINSGPFSQLGVSGNYTLSWTVASDPADTNWIVGLGETETNADRLDVDFGFRSKDGELSVREQGAWIAGGGGLAVGDVLSLSVSDTTLEYRLNGIPLHSRAFSGTEDFYIDSSFRNGAMVLSDFVIRSD